MQTLIIIGVLVVIAVPVALWLSPRRVVNWLYREPKEPRDPEERLLELEHETLRLVTEAAALRARVLAETLKLP